MDNKQVQCNGCKKTVVEAEKATTKSPQWYGKFEYDKLVELICFECYQKGVRYSK